MEYGVFVHWAPPTLPLGSVTVRRCDCTTKRNASLRDGNEIMRKRIVGPHHSQQDQSIRGWLDLEQIATVEVMSEDPSFPIESAFGPDDGPDWRAFQSGRTADSHYLRPTYVGTPYGTSFQ
jgi:hypothetical protein